MPTTYYEYHPNHLDWSGVSTVSSGYATSEYVPVTVGAGLTQSWTGSGWSTTTDYRGVYYYTTDSFASIGRSFYSYATNAAPVLSIGTDTAPPAISTSGYVLGWDGSDWTVSRNTTLPEGDEVVSLGSPTNKYKDIYVSEGTVYLGVHSLSVATNNLQYDGVDIVTGVGGTIDTSYANIANANLGVITTTQIGAANSGTTLLDANLVPTHNRTFTLGHSDYVFDRIYAKNGPKAIEFEDTGVGIGFTVNQNAENLLIFDGHEVFFGDGDVGHHGNLANVYATGIVSAANIKGDGSQLTNVSSEIVATDSTTEAGTKYITFARSNSTGVGQTIYTNTDLKYNANTHQLTLGGGLYAASITATTFYSTGSGNILFVTNLIPSTDDTYNLGSSSNRWKELYLDEGESVLQIGDVGIGVTDGHLVIDGRQSLDLDSQGDIGQAGHIRNVYATGVVTATAFIGSGSSLTGLVTNLDDLADVSTTGIATGDMLAYNGTSWEASAPPVGGGGGATCTLYEFKTSTSMTDPSSGRIRLNNSTQASATQMVISNRNDNGYDISNLIGALPIGSKIYIQRKDRPNEYHVFRTTSTPTQENNYLTIDINSFNSGNSNISDGKDVIVCFQAPNQVDGEHITPNSMSVGVLTATSYSTTTGEPVEFILDGTNLKFNIAGIGSGTVALS